MDGGGNKRIRSIDSPPPPSIYISQGKLFSKSFIYKGEWRVRPGDNPLLHSSNQKTGESLCMFTESYYSDSEQIVFNMLQSEYSDSERIIMIFDLYYSTYYPHNSTFEFTPQSMGSLRIEHSNHLAFRTVNYTMDYTAQIQLIDNKTGMPFNVSALESLQSNGANNATANGPNLMDLKIVMEMVSNDLKISVYSELTFLEADSSQIKQPIMYMFILLACLLLIIDGSNQLEECEDYFLLGNFSYVSLLMITVVHFQYVGSFVLFMIVAQTTLIMFFIFAAIITTFSTIFVYKACFLVFLYNYINHPQIDAVAFASPRILFTLSSLILLVVFYTVSIFLIGFPSYAYYLMLLHCYPYVHVWNSLRRCTKSTFIKYLQIYIWWPSAMFAIMLRGYKGNMLNLEPSYLMTTFILFTLLSCTLISYFQSVKGPLFMIPDYFLSGYMSMKVPISKVPEDKINEECSICYQELYRDPVSEEMEMQVIPPGTEPSDQPAVLRKSLREQLIKKDYKIMKTPCNHYFHVSCFNAWLEKKLECPLCKTKINFFK